MRHQPKRALLNFWRDLEGREIDWVLSYEETILPVDVKWSENPSLSDARHLKTFLNDYKLNKGYITCRCKKRRKLDDQITLLPWQEVADLFI